MEGSGTTRFLSRVSKQKQETTSILADHPAATQTETSQDPIYPIFTVPYSRNPDFIPPDEESFNVILDKISEPGSRIALLGLGGIG